MPYINRDVRATHRDLDEAILRSDVQTAGDLNYIVSRLVDMYLYHNGLNYATLNSAIGVLECAKLELYRRIAAPYEDAKLETNGDVYYTINKGDTQ